MLFSPLFIQEPIDGGFGKWSKYSKCSQSCGSGIQSRTRKCDNPVPLNGGADCAGDKTETRQCYAKPCPVNGVFGKWSKYSVCSASCGGGVQYRERKCNSPPPIMVVKIAMVQHVKHVLVQKANAQVTEKLLCNTSNFSFLM